MTKSEIKLLSDAELRIKYRAKKEKALKLPGCSMLYQGKRKLIRKMLPGRIGSEFGLLEEEYFRRFPFTPFKRKQVLKKS